ncbi:TlpA family protein disulfide reductase [Pedobacter cryophilus]|uniref:TlpA family protein disulfide reductase n=2 Tax=Pedobacter cryophilus TaxID=2571271 RepID=A0A4U1BY57_9SPHI|nr:TlpA family protein disulfide reductase [Pedobacter cryophilus]
MLIFLITLLVSPQVKGFFIQGLMKIGLFQPDVPKQSEETASTSEALVEENSEVILFKNEAGEMVNLADLKGKVVFINFWATWCPPCIAEMPSINKLQQQFKDNKNVVFLMVDVDNNLEKSMKFMKSKKFDLKVFTPASQIPPNYLGGSIPTTLLINKKGEIVFKHEGGADYTNTEFATYLDKMSKE